MRGLAKTVSQLTAARKAAAQMMPFSGSSRLSPFEDFGSNPGTLDAHVFLPAGLKPGAPLVVVLHGCTQNAAGYDRGSGWSEMAEQEGFALLFPEQRRSNNPNLCFNWFSAADARRGRGEALSIRQMVDSMVERHALNPKQVFITGLSAGGAMTSVMLAAYPELFAGGAIIAGLPFATANNVPEALERMRGQGGPANDRLSGLVTRASKHRGPWPILSVWHGTSDSTVDPINADSIVEQWRSLHKVEGEGVRDRVDGHVRHVWKDQAGRAVIEKFDIQGMGHGTPIDPSDEGCGTAGPHMLDASICSTFHIARFWGLAAGKARRTSPRPAAPSANPRERPAGTSKSAVGTVIDDALRAAGLMR